MTLTKEDIKKLGKEIIFCRKNKIKLGRMEEIVLERLTSEEKLMLCDYLGGFE